MAAVDELRGAVGEPIHQAVFFACMVLLALLGGMSAFSIYANRIAALRAREGHEADAYFVANRELDTSSTFLNLLSPMCAGLIAVLLPVRTAPILNASRPCS